jgi:hypothetical protein
MEGQAFDFLNLMPEIEGVTPRQRRIEGVTPSETPRQEIEGVTPSQRRFEGVTPSEN